MQRREFLGVVGGAAVVWPLAARAQQPERIRHVAALMDIGETDSNAKTWVEAFETQLGKAGWRPGRNCEIVYRWGASNPERLSRHAEELLRSAPDVILVHGTTALIAQRKTNTARPIVFTSVSDPVSQGFVASLAHPGGNVTGFSNYDPNIGSKWLQVLKEAAPVGKNVTVMFNPRTSPYNATLFMPSIEAAAPTFGVHVDQAPVLSDDDIGKTIAALGSQAGSGLIVPSDSFTLERAELIASLATSNRLPGIYAFRSFAHHGGLVVYGVDLEEQLRQAATYVDRILKGEKPADLPVQAPTKYQLVFNLKAAKILGLNIPPSLLATADEVIE
jgi:putative tryptophan/tyrosine transport system substrate-binding protein